MWQQNGSFRRGFVPRCFPTYSTEPGRPTLQAARKSRTSFLATRRSQRDASDSLYRLLIPPTVTYGSSVRPDHAPSNLYVLSLLSLLSLLPYRGSSNTDKRLNGRIGQSPPFPAADHVFENLSLAAAL